MPSPKPKSAPEQKSAPRPKPKHAPKPKSLSAAFEDAGKRLEKCQTKSCTAEFAASKVVPLKVTAELASIYQGRRSDAEFKRMIRDTLTRAATEESRAALTRCSVAKCNLFSLL
jgi:outer membrane biosynthesis protein TonB